MKEKSSDRNGHPATTDCPPAHPAETGEGRAEQEAGSWQRNYCNAEIVNQSALLGILTKADDVKDRILRDIAEDKRRRKVVVSLNVSNGLSLRTERNRYFVKAALVVYRPLPKISNCTL